VRVARALLLNAPLGIVFGWLAWRRGLEVAMASHLIADILIITTQHLMP
jgi:membrane protease YdiL (CAAX protease family)